MEKNGWVENGWAKHLPPNFALSFSARLCFVACPRLSARTTVEQAKEGMLVVYD